MRRYSFEIDGIKINPELPENFDCTPNDERSSEELDEWWEKPYILITELSLESWPEYYHRLKYEHGCNDDEIGTKEEFEKKNTERRESWFKTWPTGFRYDVRVLDGGAWDRSTNKGSYPTFEEALEVAKRLRTAENPD
ncbi:hypothetical protein [Hydrogenimonas sp.]